MEGRDREREKKNRGAVQAISGETHSCRASSSITLDHPQSFEEWHGFILDRYSNERIPTRSRTGRRKVTGWMIVGLPRGARYPRGCVERRDDEGGGFGG